MRTGGIAWVENQGYFNFKKVLEIKKRKMQVGVDITMYVAYFLNKQLFSQITSLDEVQAEAHQKALKFLYSDTKDQSKKNYILKWRDKDNNERISYVKEKGHDARF